MAHHTSDPARDRPVFIAGSGRCGSTLLQSILNTNSDFLIWGEHNGFLRQLADTFYAARHPRFPDNEPLVSNLRMARLRDPLRWAAWDNLCGEAEFCAHFRDFVRGFFADPQGRASRWGFKEIRYAQDARDLTFRFLFDCFPEARLVILIRDPVPTIFSMLAHWVLPAGMNLSDTELDHRIIAAAESWTRQYGVLQAFAQEHPAKCLHLRYEDFKIAGTWYQLANFLEASSFDFESRITVVKDAANKSGTAAVRVQKRLRHLGEQIGLLTAEIRSRHGYNSLGVCL